MLVTSDGREQPIYQPIPGFEHMFSVPNTQTTRSPTAALEPQTPGTATAHLLLHFANSTSEHNRVVHTRHCRSETQTVVR
jgi:hypothetical protein